jgi:small conductance mechanosensitive channel
MSDSVRNVVVAAAVVVVTLVAARLVDRAVVRRLRLTPEALTRYRVLRRGIVTTIVFVGVIGALMLIPEIRAAAGTVFASTAIIALVIGYAAQPTLANFIAGILIAFMQPLRIGDRVDASGASGVVEDIGLTYTRVRAVDGAHFYLPNSKLASDTIRNATLGSSEHLVRVSISVPTSTDLSWVMKMLAEEARKAPGTLPERRPAVSVTRVEPAAVELTVDAWTRGVVQALQSADAIRQTAYEKLSEREMRV